MSRVLILLAFITSACFAAPLNGTFLYPEKEVLDRLPDFIQKLSSLKMDTIVLHSMLKKSGNCESGAFTPLSTIRSKIPQLLDEARRKKIGVYLGLVSSMEACPRYYEGKNLEQVREQTGRLVRELSFLYKTHPALKGWYLPDEPAHLGTHLHAYFKALVEEIRKVSDKSIVVSPYLKGARGEFLPSALAVRALQFQKATGVDIQAWQDSRGAGGETRAEDYYRALARAIGPEHLWANVELFTWGRDLFRGGGYTAAPLFRLNDQLWQARADFTRKRISWLGQKHLDERLTAGIRALYLGSGRVMRPVSVNYVTYPDKAYPDLRMELFDHHVGDPRGHMDPRWVGVKGNFHVVFDLGTPRQIDLIGAHVLQMKEAHIRFPREMRVSCLDGKKKTFITRTLPVEEQDSEYVFTNLKATGLFCRRVELVLLNDGWTFVSEIELLDI